LELFSLEEEAAHVAGWPFRFRGWQQSLLFDGERSNSLQTEPDEVAGRIINNFAWVDG